MHAAKGGMAEWFKAAVLKTVERKLRGFESYSLRQYKIASRFYVKLMGKSYAGLFDLQNYYIFFIIGFPVEAD